MEVIWEEVPSKEERVELLEGVRSPLDCGPSGASGAEIMDRGVFRYNNKEIKWWQAKT